MAHQNVPMIAVQLIFTRVFKGSWHGLLAWLSWGTIPGRSRMASQSCSSEPSLLPAAVALLALFFPRGHAAGPVTRRHRQSSLEAAGMCRHLASVLAMREPAKINFPAVHLLVWTNPRANGRRRPDSPGLNGDMPVSPQWFQLESRIWYRAWGYG